MTATVAAAEVTVTGEARMGIINNFVFVPGAADETGFHQRIRVIFTMSGETDGGLAFGASIRADNAAASNAAGTAGSVFMSGAFGKISMGDVDGAANAAVGHVDGVGLTGLGDYNENTFLADGGFATNGFLAPGLAAGTLVTQDPSALYEYSAGAVSVYASVTQPSFRFAAIGNVYEGDAYGLGVAYTMGDYKVSMGYERMDVQNVVNPNDFMKIDHLIIGGDATFGQITVKARYGKADVDYFGPADDKFTQAALSATYKMDALSVTAFGSQKRLKNAVGGANVVRVDAVGLGGSYDLGGGASVKGGVVRVGNTVGAAAKVSDTAFDLGVNFTF